MDDAVFGKGEQLMRLEMKSLPEFVVLARHLNFRRAAAELSISAAALSERIRELEGRLGVRLFNRTTRSVALTDAGRQFHESIAPALASIREATAAIGSFGSNPSGVLRINGPRPALLFRLGPLLTDFLAAYPGVRAEVVADEGFTDIVAAGFDAGVRYGESLDQDMIAVSLGAPQRFVVVGSPGYFAVHGRPRHPSELKAHKCFAQVFPRGNQMAWTFEKAGEEISVMPRGPLASTDATIQLQAACAELGLAFLFEELCLADIAAGRLETVLDAWSPPFPGPYLYYPERRLMSAAMRAFVDFVKGRAGVRRWM